MSVRINPDILVWARETAGLSVEDAAERLSLTTSAKSTAAEKLLALEAGEKEPTKGQLAAAANAYKRPLLTFYMAEPPRTGPKIEDFRQSPDARGQRENAMLDALLRDIRARQETVRDLLQDEDEQGALSLVGSTSIENGVDAAVALLADVLGFDHTDLALRNGDADTLFKRLRTATEKAGVFVLVIGDLGSHHSAIPASVFRGFAIADPIAPFVVINAKDARAARSFTLIHELTHILLGQTGVSGTVSTATPRNEKARIERFCNDVAGEFLLPSHLFRKGLGEIERPHFAATKAVIEGIAQKWSVSEPMVAYRLNRTGDITDPTYDALRADYYARWQAQLARAKNDTGDKSGPNPYVVKQFSLGNALVSLVHRHMRGRVLTHTKAATLLGAKPNSVEPLLRKFETKRGSYLSGGNAAT